MRNLALLFTLTLLVAACQPSHHEVIHAGFSDSRIREIDQDCFRNNCYSLVNIDGHHYLTTSNGGATHIESCPHIYCRKVPLK